MMGNLLLSGSKIDELVSTYETTEQLLAEGTDQHLDLILVIQQAIVALTKLTIEVNDGLEAAFNTIDEQEARNAVIKLSVSLRLAKQLISLLKKTSAIIQSGIKNHLKDLIIETKQIDEFVQDLLRYKINKPHELTTLLAQIQ